MQKNEKSKKERLKKLRMILDKPSRGDLHPEDEKYLKALSKRLEESSKESIIYIRRSAKKDGEEEIDPLKPRVIIHHKEEKEGVVHIKQEEPEGQKESLFEDENLYEVEKVEVKEPEFLEIKPKEAAKEEEKIPAEKPAEELESEITKKTKEDVSEEQLPEWEPVDIKKTEPKVEETKEGEFESKDELPLPMEEKTDFEEEDFFEEELDSREEELPLTEKREKEKDEFSPDASKTVFLTPDSSVSDVERDSKIDVFRDIESIDEKTAVLLYDNGFTSIDAVKKASLKDLTKSGGVKRKLAKKIKKEIDETVKKNEENIDYHAVEEDNPFIEEDVDEWDSYEEDEIPEQKVKEVKGYRHGDYTLYKKEVETSSGKKRIVHFFSKAEPDEGVPVESPAGFEVKVNKKTGVPYLRKKSKKK